LTSFFQSNQPLVTVADARVAAQAAADSARRVSSVGSSFSLSSLRAPKLRFVGFDQAVRESTFFPLGGKSLQDILEQREWTGHYANAEMWTTAVVSCCEGRTVRIPTSDGRTISAFFCRRSHDHALRERDFQHLVADGAFISSPQAASVAASAPQQQQQQQQQQQPVLPPESAVVLFHANAMVGLDMVEYALWYRRQVSLS
jgi:hypothetical protein